ncbi:Flap endonuclease 1 [uncultured archaeon]|nr:Flap endonuclease 1 [uncultured archaeon]
MGVNLKDIVPYRQIEFDELKGKTIAVDALNTLYQFLASIRQPDGTPLMDTQGNVTSHLAGLMYRTGRLLRMGIRPVYVFDGTPHPLKKTELDRRKKLKEESQTKWDEAKQAGRLDEARKYAQRTGRLTKEMTADARTLLSLMGVPYVEAPGEGEAQCAYMVQKGDAWASASQDYDSILFGAPRLIRNLTLTGQLELQLVELAETLKQTEATREQLVDAAILAGTDFNEGVFGIGPKKGLKVAREGKTSEQDVGAPLDDVRAIFLTPNVTDKYDINWGKLDENKLVAFLNGEHQFSENRVRTTAHEIQKALNEQTQQNLNKWF